MLTKMVFIGLAIFVEFIIVMTIITGQKKIHNKAVNQGLRFFFGAY